MLTKRPYLAVLVSLTFVGLAGIPSAIAQTLTARGTATAVTDVSVTVKVGPQDVTFAVDNKTVVEAPGAGTKTRAARSAGEPGIPLTSAIQSGQPVLVSYQEVNGKKLATHISRVSSAGSGAGSMAEPATAATGVIKSVTASALVLTANGKDSTFAVDRETRVIGRGAGTATEAAGGRVPISTLVSAGDTVQVSYSTVAGTMRATEVRVTAKAR